MNVHVLGECAERMDAIRRLISIPPPVGGDRIFLASRTGFCFSTP